MQLNHLRVLEIGYFSVIQEVECIGTFINVDLVGRPPGRSRLLDLLSDLRRVFQETRTTQYDLVIVREMARFIYRKDRPLLINLLRWLLGHYLVWCLKSVKRMKIPIAVVDIVDEDCLDPRDLPLLAMSTCYFKRELPLNRLRIFSRTAPHHEEPCLKASRSDLGQLASKLRPISLGFLANMHQQNRIDREPRFDSGAKTFEKEFDIFFSGHTHLSYIRMMGISQLHLLRDEGYKIMILEDRVPQQEFWDLMARSWLTWSPEGIGWDCYRHYEAALAGSVALVNYPSTFRHQPLQDGIHAIYYGVENDGLLHAARKALEDKSLLLSLAANARQLVMNHHTPRKRGEYIIRKTLLQADQSKSVPLSKS